MLAYDARVCVQQRGRLVGQRVVREDDDPALARGGELLLEAFELGRADPRLRGRRRG